LYYIFEVIWLDFSRFRSANSHFSKLKWTMLEIIPPQEIERGPKTIESLYSAISGSLSTITVFDEYALGKFDDRFSFEIVGEEGKVHFYIRAQVKYRSMIESQIYAKYPDAEIIEVPDYTAHFPIVIPNKNWDLWGADFQFNAPNSYPFKTYDKFEESVTGEMIDPLASVVEILGQLPPGQHLWFQLVMSPLREEWKLDKSHKKIMDKLTGRGAGESKGILGHLADVFANLIGGLLGPVEFGAAEKKEQAPLEFRLTPVEKDVLKGVEEKLGQSGFLMKMRMVYLGTRDNFSKSYLSFFIGAMKQYMELNMNSFKPESISKTYGYYIGRKWRLAFRKRKIYKRYKERNMDGVKLIFSTKEMATLFHLPDMHVRSPAMSRVASKLGSAPPNLPIE
jgi:hypothetical protein